MHNQGHSEENGKRTPRFGWGFKAVFFTVMALIGFSSHALNGWGGAVAVALAALIVPIVGSRGFWNQGRFWITAFLLAVVQIPLTIALKPEIEELGFVSLLAIGVVDCAAVAVAITWVCTQRDCS